jgi:hypothetical protein
MIEKERVVIRKKVKPRLITTTQSLPRFRLLESKELRRTLIRIPAAVSGRDVARYSSNRYYRPDSNRKGKVTEPPSGR